MTKSHFAVSHGMHHDDNYSCALDIANLAKHALDKHAVLKEVVNTKTYTLQSILEPNHVYLWNNTNSLLWDESGCYTGIKTGVTPSAGPCLSVCYKSASATNNTSTINNNNLNHLEIEISMSVEKEEEP